MAELGVSSGVRVRVRVMVAVSAVVAFSVWTGFTV
jgi:hypothetical protein